MTPVRLTTRGGETLYVNPDKVAFFKKHPDGKGTLVCVEYGSQSLFEHVRETPAQVLRRLDGKKSRMKQPAKSCCLLKLSGRQTRK